jgi:agmatine deiminase
LQLKLFRIQFLRRKSSNLNSLLQNIKFYFHPTNDAWCRDHGPTFFWLAQNTNQAIVGGGGYSRAINIRRMIWTMLYQHYWKRVGFYQFFIKYCYRRSVEFNGKGTV